MDITTTLTTAISTVKQLFEFKDKIDDAKFALLVADLSMNLAEVKSQLAAVMMENVSLKGEISELKKKKSQEVIFEGGAYYKVDDGKYDGPYCTGCYDVKQNLVRLSYSRDFGLHICPACNKPFDIKEIGK